MKKAVSLILAVMLAVCAAVPCFGAGESEIDAQLKKTAEYIVNRVPNPGPGDQGGDWSILGLARSGAKVPEGYYEKYYESMVSLVRTNNGVLSSRKYTEYSRSVVALSAIGADVENVGGYNLLKPLADFNAVKWQGLNGPAWALIALDCRDYEIPENADAPVQATRQMYVDYILSMQLEDGGFNLTGKGETDVDVTGMTIQALVQYKDQPAVKDAIEKAQDCLAELQQENGLFDCGGKQSCESVAQVITALCALGSGYADSRFTRDGKDLVDRLMGFALADGSFENTAGGGASQMATEQAFYALAAAKRFNGGESRLMRMTDAEALVETAAPLAEGLPGKNENVHARPVTKPGLTFSDINACAEKTAIEALASRGIISGMGEGKFAPENTMTRAQFATIVTLGLGLEPEDTGVFNDVKSSAWYAGYVGTANRYDIVNGRGAGKFDPEATITKQEAAIMVAKAAKLCGMDIAMDETGTRNILAQFGDYTTAASWAQPYLAFCYWSDILDQSELNVDPLHQVTRAEIAGMLYKMLLKANLL